jgi:hypothetical protein
VAAWLLPLCLIIAGLAAASPAIPMWMPWLVPGALAVLFVIAWDEERAATGGDPEPGLVALVGIVSVAATGAAIGVGYLVRRRGN